MIPRRENEPRGSVVKNPPAMQEMQRFDPWAGKIPWRTKWQPTSVCPGKSHGQRNLLGYTVHGVARVGHNLVTKATTKRENITQREETKV